MKENKNIAFYICTPICAPVALRFHFRSCAPIRALIPFKELRSRCTIGALHVGFRCVLHWFLSTPDWSCAPIALQQLSCTPISFLKMRSNYLRNRQLWLQKSGHPSLDLPLVLIKNAYNTEFWWHSIVQRNHVEDLWWTRMHNGMLCI